MDLSKVKVLRVIKHGELSYFLDSQLEENDIIIRMNQDEDVLDVLIEKKEQVLKQAETSPAYEYGYICTNCKSDHIFLGASFCPTCGLDLKDYKYE